MSRVPVAVLVSGSGTNLQALIDATADPTHPARIVVVVADRPKAFGLERARRAGIPTEVVLKRDHPDRAAYDAALAQTLTRYGVEWVCLAGFMKVVGSPMLEAFPDRILNIHPALLPAFPGLHGPAQALAHGVCIAGATVHLVDEGMDTGPIVIQGAVPVLEGDDEHTLAQRILTRVEHVIYPRALRWAAEGRLVVERAGRARVRVEGAERQVWGGTPREREAPATGDAPAHVPGVTP